MATFGNIIIFTGILPLASTPSGLAGIIGHEIAHVELRHPSERLSLMRAVGVGRVLWDLVGLDVGLSRLVGWLAVE